MKIGVIILSRFNSSRLPGKALMTLEGKPVLQYIVERLLQVVPKENILLATSEENTDDPIREFAKKVGLDCFRGSLDNVSQRFYNAAKSRGFDYAIRINGDNVFLDIPTLKGMLDIAMSNKFDFLSNVKNRTFPKGMSIEIARVSYYNEHHDTIIFDPYHSEHVMSYFYTLDSNSHYYHYNTEIKGVEGVQLALDTKEDFVRTQNIIQSFTGDHVDYNLKDIYEIYKKLKI